MVSFVFFCFAVIGMTNILVDSKLFEPVREYYKIRSNKIYEILNCHQCCGTWVGFFCGFSLLLFNNNWVDFFNYIIEIPIHGTIIYLLYSLLKLIVLTLLSGCAGSFLSSTHYMLIELILSKTDYSLDYTEDSIESKILE